MKERGEGQRNSIIFERYPIRLHKIVCSEEAGEDEEEFEDEFLYKGKARRGEELPLLSKEIHWNPPKNLCAERM